MTFLHLTCGFNHRLRWWLDCRSVYLQLTCGFNHRWSWVKRKSVTTSNDTCCLVEKQWIDAVSWIHLMNQWPSWWILLIWNKMTFLHLTGGFNHRWRWWLDCRSIYQHLTCGFDHRWSWVEMMFKRANIAKTIILRLVGNQRS